MDNESKSSHISGRRHLLLNLLFLLIAVLSVWAVSSQARGFSPREFSQYLERNNPWYLAGALAAMLGYILLGALAIRCLLKGFGYRRSLGSSVSYVAADLYFSAITPSATGGQPMEGYFMKRDGIPWVICTAALMTNLLLYTLSIVIIGALGLILRPSSFLRFGPLSRYLIILGVCIQLSLVLVYSTLLWNKALLRRLGSWVLRLLARLRLVRDLESHQQRLDGILDRYGEATRMLRGRRALLWKGLALNVAHRGCQLLVTVFCFLAGGGSWRMTPDIFSIQCNVVLGASCVPIPGAMGITDLMMLDGFSSILNEVESTNLELLSRALSFYICILLCGLISLIKYAIIRFRRQKT